MLNLWKRGRIWWVRGTFDGSEFKPRSLDTSDAVIAKRLLRDLELKIACGEQDHSWAELKEAFLRKLDDPARGAKPRTRSKYRYVVERFDRFLSSRHIPALADITRDLLSQYSEERRHDVHPTLGTTVGAEGLKSDLRILRVCFNFAVEQELMKKNPVKKFGNLHASSRDTQPFKDDEISRMLEAAACLSPRTRPDLKAIVLTFLSTGLRISDVVGLNKSDVDLTNRRIIRRTRKRNKVVYLAIPVQLQDVLDQGWPQNAEQQSSPLVFATRTGKEMRNLDSILRRLWRRAEVVGGHAHRFRDTFAVQMLRQGASIFDVSQLLGITEDVCRKHYAPYSTELQERGMRFASALRF